MVSGAQGNSDFLRVNHVVCLYVSILSQSPSRPSQLYERFFEPQPRASRSVFACIVYVFLAPSSAFEARLVGKSTVYPVVLLLTELTLISIV